MAQPAAPGTEPAAAPGLAAPFELLNRGPVYVVAFVLFMMLVVIQFSFSSSVPKLLVRTQRQLEPSDL